MDSIALPTPDRFIAFDAITSTAKRKYDQNLPTTRTTYVVLMYSDRKYTH